MVRMQCVPWLIVMTVGLIDAWDIAVSHGDLLEFYTNETKVDTVRIHSHNLTALTYDEVHNMVLYVDKQSGNDAICAHDISSKESKCLIERNGRNIHGISFDPVTELLFFTDTNERTINWISLKSGSKNNDFGNLLIKIDHGIPTDIAVDSCRGYVYWINTNLTTPTIERARFSGTEREVFISIKSLPINTTYQLEPHSLTIDQHTQKMYWIEPMTSTKYQIRYIDLNEKNITELSEIEPKIITNPSSNKLTVSKTTLFRADWCYNCEIQIAKLGKIEWTGVKYLKLSIKDVDIGIVANYKIKERIQDIKDCEALTSLELNNSDVPFCVHGVKVIGQSLCKCIPGYIGNRCDVSVCDNNYCLQGNCSVTDDGLPECRCNAGYSGERCEVDSCRGFCLNSGVCFLDEEDEPSCECVDGYQGPRCEAIQTVTFTFTNASTCSEDTNRILAELLAKWPKPKTIVFNF